MIISRNENNCEVNLKPLSKLEQFFLDKGHAKGTQGHYRACVNLYEKLNGLSLDELIIEAEKEEDEKIPWKRRTLKKRLMDFRNYIYSNLLEKTCKTYFGDIKTIYRHFEVEVHPLPSMNSKQINKSYEKDFEDLLTMDEIVAAYYAASQVFQDIIVLGVSTGLAKADMLKLTVDDWIEFNKDNTQSQTLEGKLIELVNSKDVFVCIKGERQKTKSKYTTFASPEASEHINQHLLNRYYSIPIKYKEMEEKIEKETNLQKKEKLIAKLEKMPQKLEGHHKLFEISNNHLDYQQREINKKLGLGKVGTYSKFRCHQLRSFHASTLLNLGFTESEVDALQGRKKDMTHRAYLIESKDKLFKKYYDHVDNLMLFKSIHSIDEEAYEKLENENKYFKNEIKKNNVKLNEQEKKIEKILSIQAELEELLDNN